MEALVLTPVKAVILACVHLSIRDRTARSLYTHAPYALVSMEAFAYQMKVANFPVLVPKDTKERAVRRGDLPALIDLVTTEEPVNRNPPATCVYVR